MGTFADEQVLYNNNPSPTTAVGLAQMRYNQTAIRELPGASAPVIVGITDGAISPTSAFVRVDTEGQAEGDELEVISPVLSDTDSLHDGMILYLQAADQDRVVTVRPTVSANGIQTFDGQDVVLDTTTWLVLQLRQGTWYEMRDLFSKTLKGLVDAAQATADGKANADLDDVTAAGKAVMAHAAMPDPSRVVQLSIPTQTIASWPTGYYQWTAPVDCYVSIQTAKSGTGSVLLRVAYGEYTTADSESFRNNTVAADENLSNSSSAYLSVNFFVPKDQTITIVHNCPYATWGKYFPCIGTAS